MTKRDFERAASIVQASYETYNDACEPGVLADGFVRLFQAGA